MSNLSVRVADLADYLKTLPTDVEFPISSSEEGQAFIRVAIELPTATIDPIVQPGPALATLGEVPPAKEVIPSQDAQAQAAMPDVVIPSGNTDAGSPALGDVAADAQGTVAADPVADAAASLGDGGFSPAAGVDTANA